MMYDWLYAWPPGQDRASAVDVCRLAHGATAVRLLHEKPTNYKASSSMVKNNVHWGQCLPETCERNKTREIMIIKHD